MEETLELMLTGGKDAPARARFALSGLNGSLAGLRQSVRLLVSELVANAVKHGAADRDGNVWLRLTSSPDRVRVEVADQGPGFQPPSEPIDPLEHGFGLVLVDELADRWGVAAENGAKVWFEIDRAQAHPA